MAFTDNTMFEITVSNSSRNNTQHVSGMYGSMSDNTFTGTDCSAGFLVTPDSLIPSEGYESFDILNGNTWYMVNATNTSGSGHDHTGIYALDVYDVNKVISGDLQYNLGAHTLGLGLPSGVRGDFCELIIGEQYTWGAGNLSGSSIAVGDTFYVNNGVWTKYTASTGIQGLTAKLLRTKPITEGTYPAQTGYVLKIVGFLAAASGD
jgi:hypothetical protein